MKVDPLALHRGRALGRETGIGHGGLRGGGFAESAPSLAFGWYLGYLTGNRIYVQGTCSAAGCAHAGRGREHPGYVPKAAADNRRYVLELKDGRTKSSCHTSPLMPYSEH